MGRVPRWLGRMNRAAGSALRQRMLHERAGAQRAVRDVGRGFDASHALGAMWTGLALRVMLLATPWPGAARYRSHPIATDRRT